MYIEFEIIFSNFQNLSLSQAPDFQPEKKKKKKQEMLSADAWTIQN